MIGGRFGLLHKITLPNHPNPLIFPIRTKVPQFNPHNIKFDGRKIISACRLIALTVEDFNGKEPAIEI
jgi:hypothetical protein